MTDDSRYRRGLEKLAEIDGRAGEEVVAPLGALGRYIVEFAFGDIYSRGTLTLREREIATIAMLTVLSGREKQLRVHIGAGLNIGLTAAEIEETILQTVPYCGFPTAINAMQVLREITPLPSAGH
ncbi:MAG: carboxymuconolactone decarboxylase family protein [Telmatospirillum sp.]|nr:carboxymuconolactone decarboxylase family protein [Telmatospirillum sp.]